MLNDTSNVNDDTANEKNVTNNDRVIVDEHQQLLCLDNVCDKKHKQIVSGEFFFFIHHFINCNCNW